MSIPECSFRTRADALKRFSDEVFDLVVIGGGITGTSVARAAAMRGMRVALVEKGDFAQGTSSKSSKLIHGGVRYLENLEFHLVFEALSERAWMLRAAKHLVKPLSFCLPVYRGHKYPRWVLGLGLWFYDLLALFRTPGVHRYFSKEKTKRWLPSLEQKNLLGSFQFYDASMWDDALAVETARSAVEAGASVANYVEATGLVRQGTNGVVEGVEFKDLVKGGSGKIRAKQVVFCLGPWTDAFGQRVYGKDWESWLQPSRGTHLVFDAKRFSLASAVIMEHPTDGRISFAIPRPDLGAGVTIVGTTDGPSPNNPDTVATAEDEIEYLLGLLKLYFPTEALQKSDVVGTYVGVRPLAKEERHQGTTLQKISREHRIGMSPGGVVTIAGGKYTTARKIADQVVQFAVTHNESLKKFHRPWFKKDPTRQNINPRVRMAANASSAANSVPVPIELWRRYGEESATIMTLGASSSSDPEGFPYLESQVRFAVRYGMAMRLEDALVHRIGLSLARKDKGQPWTAALQKVFDDEIGA